MRFSLFERLNRVCGAALGLSGEQSAAAENSKCLNLKALKVKSLAYDVLGYARLFSMQAVLAVLGILFATVIVRS